MERDRIGEIQDRLRRIETRLTKYMQERGFETQVQKSHWIDGPQSRRLEVPSLDIRLKDILEKGTDQFDGSFDVYHQGERIVSLTLP